MTSLVTQPRTLVDVLLLQQRRSWLLDAVLVVLFSAFVGLTAQVEILLWPVPLTLQTLGVLRWLRSARFRVLDAATETEGCYRPGEKRRQQGLHRPTVCLLDAFLAFLDGHHHRSPIDRSPVSADLTRQLLHLPTATATWSNGFDARRMISRCPAVTGSKLPGHIATFIDAPKGKACAAGFWTFRYYARALSLFLYFWASLFACSTLPW